MKSYIQSIKLISRLALLLVCDSPLQAQTPPPVRVMPLGDSITQGCCSGTTTEGGYRNKLYYLLTAQSFNLDFVGSILDFNNPVLPDRDHEGRPGARINDLRQNIASWLKASEDPDVILLNIGTNDFYNGSSVAAALDSIRNLIVDLSSLRPHAKIIVSSLLPRTDTVERMQLHESFNEALPAMVSEQAALGRQVSFADIHAAVSPEYLSADGVHPTLAGYDKMADGWLPAIQQVITPLGTSDPPMIAGVSARTDLGHVTLKFSKPIKDADAVPANFSINGGVSVLQASLDAATKRIVTLSTGNQSPGTIYDLTVTGIHDRTPAENTIKPGTVRKFTSMTVTDGSFEQNGLQWTGSGNYAIYSPENPKASDGSTLVVFNDGERSPNGLVSQTVPTIAGQKYLLSFDMGVYAFNKQTQSLALTVTDNIVGQVILSRSDALNGLGGATGSTLWVSKESKFVATSASTTLTFQDTSPVTDSIDLLLDNIQMDGLVSRTLAVQASPPSALKVTVSPADSNANGDGVTDLARYYDDLTVVTLTAPLLSPGGGAFEKWLKNGVDYSLNFGTTITMDANIVMTAVYAPPTVPIANDDSFAGYVETPLQMAAPGVLSNDTDAKSVSLTASLVAPPAHGLLVMNSDGSFTYTPEPAFTGIDSFTYQAFDGGLNSNTAAVNLTVNAAPPGVPVNGSFELGSPSDYGLLYGWSGSGNRQGLMTTASYPSTEGNRIATFNLGNNVFDAVISQSFATTPGQLYTVEFDMGIYGSVGYKQWVQVTVAGTGVLVFRVEEMIAKAGSAHWYPKGYSFVADSTVTTLTLSDASGSLPLATSQNSDTLLDNVRVSESSPFTLRCASSPLSGVAVALSQSDINGLSDGLTDFVRSYGNGSVVTLTAPLVVGNYRFKKWQKNGSDFTMSPAATVTIDGSDTFTAVYAPNTPPVANTEVYTTVDGGTLTTAAPGVLANDTDADGNELSAVLESPPAHGSLALNANGSFTYTPVPGYEGADAFTYRASDDVETSAVATVDISINPLGPLVNGSHEDGMPEDFGHLDGWSASGDALGFLYLPPNYAALPGNGARFTCFNNGDEDFSGILSQRFATIPGATYALEYDLGITGSVGKKQSLLVTVTGSSPTPLLSVEKQISATGGPTFWESPTSTSHTFIADSNATTLEFRDNSGTLALTQSQYADMLLDNVRVTLISAPLGHFSDWITENSLPADPTIDTDWDSISNIIEYIIDGDPVHHNDLNLLPTAQLVLADPDGDLIASRYLLFTYRWSDRSAADPTVDIKVEWSTDLTTSWNNAAATAGVVILSANDAAAVGVDLVNVYIPRSLEVNGRLFVRLRGVFNATK
jgi:lysophospholipase L1-like esterase